MGQKAKDESRALALSKSVRKEDMTPVEHRLTLEPSFELSKDFLESGWASLAGLYSWNESLFPVACHKQVIYVLAKGPVPGELSRFYRVIPVQADKNLTQRIWASLVFLNVEIPKPAPPLEPVSPDPDEEPTEVYEGTNATQSGDDEEQEAMLEGWNNKSVTAFDLANTMSIALKESMAGRQPPSAVRNPPSSIKSYEEKAPSVPSNKAVEKEEASSAQEEASEPTSEPVAEPEPMAELASEDDSNHSEGVQDLLKCYPRLSEPAFALQDVFFFALSKNKKGHPLVARQKWQDGVAKSVDLPDTQVRLLQGRIIKHVLQFEKLYHAGCQFFINSERETSTWSTLATLIPEEAQKKAALSFFPVDGEETSYLVVAVHKEVISYELLQVLQAYMDEIDNKRLKKIAS